MSCSYKTEIFVNKKKISDLFIYLFIFNVDRLYKSTISIAHWFFYYLLTLSAGKTVKLMNMKFKTHALHHIVQSHSMRWLRVFGGPILAPGPYV